MYGNCTSSLGMLFNPHLLLHSTGNLTHESLCDYIKTKMTHESLCDYIKTKMTHESLCDYIKTKMREKCALLAESVFVANLSFLRLITQN